MEIPQKTKTTTQPFQIGGSLRYTNDRQIVRVDIVDINNNDTDSTKYISKLLRGNTMIVTKEFLKPRNVPDIGPIPILS